MARDREILAQAENGQAGCRVYEWDGPWVSLGKQQVAERDLLDPKLVPWVMRPTGGKAVLHGHDITVGLALPLELIATQTGLPVERLSRSVKTVYRFVARPLMAALNESGLNVALGEETELGARGPRSTDCFAHVSPNDIVDVESGVKVCGCALRLTASAVLVQASIPCGRPLLDPAKLFDVPQLSGSLSWDSAGFGAALKDALGNLG